MKRKVEELQGVARAEGCEIVIRVRENPRPESELFDAVAELLIDLAEAKGLISTRSEAA